MYDFVSSRVNPTWTFFHLQFRFHWAWGVCLRWMHRAYGDVFAWLCDRNKACQQLSVLLRSARAQLAQYRRAGKFQYGRTIYQRRLRMLDAFYKGDKYLKPSEHEAEDEKTPVLEQLLSLQGRTLSILSKLVSNLLTLMNSRMAQPKYVSYSNLQTLKSHKMTSLSLMNHMILKPKTILFLVLGMSITMTMISNRLRRI